MINYSENKSTLEQIENHLLQCDNTFIPNLSEYVDIKEYSKKILNKTIRFECFDDEKLIGLIAAYKGEKLYITNVSTDPDYTKKGIGGTLIKIGEEFCKLNNLKYMELEVKPQNQKAIAFYEKRGFKIKDLSCKYEKKLTP